MIATGFFMFVVLLFFFWFEEYGNFIFSFHFVRWKTIRNVLFVWATVRST